MKLTNYQSLKLKSWLVMSKLTQTSLAKQVGVSQQYISAVIRCKKAVSSKLRAKLEELGYTIRKER